MTFETAFLKGHDNLSMPADTVIPVLHYPDVPAAAAWLCQAFGFAERLRIGTHRIQLGIGLGALVIAQASGPRSDNDMNYHSIMVRVANADQHFINATRAGARVVSEPASFPYGERQYSAADLAGHVWTFSQTEANVDPKCWGGQLV